MRRRGFEVVLEYANAGIMLPVRKTKHSAGYDIRAAATVEIPPRQCTVIPTGLKAYMLPDEYLGVHIRSSMACKHQLMLMNSQGIIDADYYNNAANEGHIMIAVYNCGNAAVNIVKGTRVAQAIFNKYLRIDDDDETAAQVRSGGIGSTGEE